MISIWKAWFFLCLLFVSGSILHSLEMLAEWGLNILSWKARPCTGRKYRPETIINAASPETTGNYSASIISLIPCHLLQKHMEYASEPHFLWLKYMILAFHKICWVRNCPRVEIKV